MTKGRKSLPVAAHLMNGNASKLTEAEIKARMKAEKTPQISVVLPEPPSFLTDRAVVEWKRLGSELVRLGLISDMDLVAYAGYCQAFAEWADLSERIKNGGFETMVDTTPNNFKQMSVLVQLRNKAWEQTRLCFADFGMTPASRAKFTAVSAQLNLFGNDNGNTDTPTPAPGSQANPEQKFFTH